MRSRARVVQRGPARPDRGVAPADALLDDRHRIRHVQRVFLPEPDCRLTPEVGSVFQRALGAAVAADRGAAAVAGADGSAAAAAEVEGGAAAVAGADGSAAVAASAGGADRPDAVDEATGVERSLGQRQADALGRLAECALAGGLDRGTAGDRYQVVLHVDAETLAGDLVADGPGPDAGDAATDGHETGAVDRSACGDVSAGRWAQARTSSDAGAASEDAHGGVPAGTPRPAVPVAEDRNAGGVGGNGTEAVGADGASADVPEDSVGAESMARLAVWKVDRSKNVEAAEKGIEWSRPQPVERSPDRPGETTRRLDCRGRGPDC